MNAKQVLVDGPCKHCGKFISRILHASVASVDMSCGCIKYYAPHSSVFIDQCVECNKVFVGRQKNRQFCSDACRCRAKRKRKSLGSLLAA
jgi:hypothetical protein